MTCVYTNAYHCYCDVAGGWIRLGPGNRAKCEKHGLSIAVIEGLFARPLAILPDATHSQREKRLRAIGRTDKGRGVFIIFTLRRKAMNF